MSTRTIAVVLGIVVVQTVVLVALLGRGGVAPADDERTARELSRLTERIAKLERRLAERHETATRRDRVIAAPPANVTEAVTGGPGANAAPPRVSTNDPRLVGVPANQLLLEAEERLGKNEDLAGAVSRYRAILPELASDARPYVLRRLGLALQRLGHLELARGRYRDAISEGGATLEGASALFDLIMSFSTDNDADARQVRELAGRYRRHVAIPFGGRVSVEARASRAARQLKLFDEERVALEWLRENAPERNLPFTLRPRMREVLGE